MTILASLITLINIGITWAFLSKLYFKSVKKNTLFFGYNLELTGLPIITMKSNGVKLNFLLDTGSSSSCINKKVLLLLDPTTTKTTSSYVGINGSTFTGKDWDIIIEHKRRKYKEFFIEADLNKAFLNIEETSGIKLHGILGNSFFQKYNFVIDINRSIAYPKF